MKVEMRNLVHLIILERLINNSILFDAGHYKELDFEREIKDILAQNAQKSRKLCFTRVFSSSRS